MRLKRVGGGVMIHAPATITGAANIELGSNVHIGQHALIRGEGGLKIGDNTHIARYCHIYTYNHRYEGEALPYDDTVIARPVEIGRNVWIGLDVRIAPGTVIGDGVVVAMGTVVHGNVPAGAVIGPQPWRVLKWRDPERYEALDGRELYGGPNGTPLEK